MTAATRLYTSEVLGLATSLSRWPLTDELSHYGNARAPTCGSTIELGLGLDDQGRIHRIGIKSHACAIGQASAALFGSAAGGKTQTDIAGAMVQIEQWLADEAMSLPDWPGFAAIAAARGYPARHGAILLPWKAALAALP